MPKKIKPAKRKAMLKEKYGDVSIDLAYYMKNLRVRADELLGCPGFRTRNPKDAFIGTLLKQVCYYHKSKVAMENYTPRSRVGLTDYVDKEIYFTGKLGGIRKFNTHNKLLILEPTFITDMTHNIDPKKPWKFSGFKRRGQPNKPFDTHLWLELDDLQLDEYYKKEGTELAIGQILMGVGTVHSYKGRTADGKFHRNLKYGIRDVTVKFLGYCNNELFIPTFDYDFSQYSFGTYNKDTNKWQMKPHVDLTYLQMYNDLAETTGDRDQAFNDTVACILNDLDAITIQRTERIAEKYRGELAFQLLLHSMEEL